jgi:cytochrome c
MHRGVLGRTAGKVAAYDFSAALRASTLVWTQQNLLTWLQDPEKLIPDQQMGYRVDGLQDRLDIVAYLATMK